MILRLLPSGLTLSNLHHRQRIHKLCRGYELRSPRLVLSELEDEHDLHRNVWFAIIKRAVGDRLRGRLPSVLYCFTLAQQRIRM